MKENDEMYLQYISQGIEGQMRTSHQVEVAISSLELWHHVVMLNSQHGSSHCSNVLLRSSSHHLEHPLTYCLHLLRQPWCLDDAAPSPSPLSSIAADPVTDTKLYVFLLKCHGCSHRHPTASASSTLHYWVGSPPCYSYLTKLFHRSWCLSLNKYWLTGKFWIDDWLVLIHE